MYLILITTSCEINVGKKEVANYITKSNVSSLNKIGDIDTFICTSKNSKGKKVILTIVRNNENGFTTVHEEFSDAGTNDVPTVYFDESLNNSYIESQSSLHLTIPSNSTYFFIPFEKNPISNDRELIIKDFKDFTCDCCATINENTQQLCSKVHSVLNGLNSWGCIPFQNCDNCGFIPNDIGKPNTLDAGVILQASTVVYN